MLRLVRRHGDASLLVRGLTHIVSLSSWESFALLEIYVGRAYCQVAGFEPDRDWTVVDVGANIGAYSLLQARRGAHVYAIEPNPDCYSRLDLAVRTNGLGDRVTAIQCAIGSRSGFVRMRVAQDQTQLGCVEPAEAADDTVPIASLDDLMTALGLHHIDLLKMDVEGYESEVLCGAEATLPKIDRVVMEYHSEVLRREACDVLARHRFAVICPRGTYGCGELYAIR
jgi:FkbM family methyltransferase